MRRKQTRFANDDWEQATAEEKAAAWGNYFGTYVIDEKVGAVTHRIEGSWFPNLVGTEQTRRFRFEDEQPVLDADTPWGQVNIIWEKIG